MLLSAYVLIGNAHLTRVENVENVSVSRNVSQICMHHVIKMQMVIIPIHDDYNSVNRR